MEKNNKLWLGILIGVLASLVVGVVGYIVYDKVLSENNNEIVNNEDITDNDIDSSQEQQKEVTVDLSLDSTIVETLAGRVIGVFTNNYETNYKDYFYKRDKITLLEEDMTFKLSLAAKWISSDFLRDLGSCINDACYYVSYIEEDKLKEAYYDIFGNDSHYERAPFEIDSCTGYYNLVFKNGIYRYEAKDPDGCGGAVCGGAESKLGYAKQIISSDVDKIELYEYFYYVQCLEDGEGSNIYSDYNKNNLIHVGYLNSEEVFSKYKNQLGQYKYTFEKDKYGTYVFTSVEKVK